MSSISRNSCSINVNSKKLFDLINAIGSLNLNDQDLISKDKW